MVKHSARERYPYKYGGGHGDAGRGLLAEGGEGSSLSPCRTTSTTRLQGNAWSATRPSDRGGVRCLSPRWGYSPAI